MKASCTAAGAGDLRALSTNQASAWRSALPLSRRLRSRPASSQASAGCISAVWLRSQSRSVSSARASAARPAAKSSVGRRKTQFSRASAAGTVPVGTSSSTTGTRRFSSARAMSSSWRHTGEASEAALSMNTKASAPRMPSSISAIHSALGGMSDQSTHRARPRSARASLQWRTAAWLTRA
jgi:hypothetical protein